MEYQLEQCDKKAFLEDLSIKHFLEKNGRIFQQPSYLTSMPGKLHIWKVTFQDKIVGLLPLILRRKFFVLGSHIPPYAYVYGPVISGDTGLDREKVLNLLLKVTRKLDFCEMKIPISNADIMPYLKIGGKVIASQTHILSRVVDFNEKHIHDSKRRYLKKLFDKLNNGEIILTEGPETYDDLVWLQVETGKKSGFHVNINTISAIINNLGQDRCFSLVLKSQDGRPLSGAFCPYDRFSAYHLINASVHHEDPILNRSNILSTFIAIKKSMELGRNFDFEGSNIPGVAQFYRMMGGKPSLIFRIQISPSLKGRFLTGLKHMR